MIKKSRVDQRRKVKRRIALKVRGSAEHPRLTVYRSLRHIYAQVVDDGSASTLAAASSLSPELRDQLKGKKGMKEIARHVGMQIGKKALDKKITRVVFDRNGYRFHGIVKAMADGAREAGLKF